MKLYLNEFVIQFLDTMSYEGNFNQNHLKKNHFNAHLFREYKKFPIIININCYITLLYEVRKSSLLIAVY